MTQIQNDLGQYPDVIFDTPFKGSRDYILAANLFNSVESFFKDRNIPFQDKISISYNKPARHICGIILADDRPPLWQPEEFVARVVYGSGPSKKLGWIVETSTPVENRVAFDEHDIIGSSSINGKIITLNSDVKYSSTEVAVVLTKHLHQTLIPDPKRRWVVSRIDLSRPLPENRGKDMVVEMDRAEYRPLTRSRVTCGKMTGDLYFSLVSWR